MIPYIIFARSRECFQSRYYIVNCFNQCFSCQHWLFQVRLYKEKGWSPQQDFRNSLKIWEVGGVSCFLICISRHINRRSVCAVVLKTFYRLGSHPVRKRSNVGSLVMNQACSFETEKAATVHQVRGWKYIGRTNFAWTVNMYVKVTVSG